MRQRQIRFVTFPALLVAAVVACTTPNPNYRKPPSDGAMDDSGRCESGAALRCDGMNLVRCSADGTSEVSEPCSLSCNAVELRCSGVAPSNSLVSFLDLANGQPDLNLGDSAMINTDTGEVKVGGNSVPTYSGTLAQPGGPIIRVLAVRSLVGKDVVVTGKNALAIVSAGDIKINGELVASAKQRVPGAGAFADGNCRGQNQSSGSRSYGGAGGGGFGTPGGSGGSAKQLNGFATGGVGGTVTGNAELVPLRGGCGGGSDITPADYGGGGGGAIQLVSSTQIAISGTVAANGAQGWGGGGSGGGIMLEAPIVDVSGRVVANGAGGEGHTFGEDGRSDALPARGGDSLFDSTFQIKGRGGNGAAGNSGATDGDSVNTGQLDIYAIGGSGGGGGGRIRVNTASGAIRGAGAFSPRPSTGTLASR